jgi:lipoprotein NlpD
LEDSQSQYTVKKGDTLYRIAMEKGQSYTDLIVWNNLANPHDIKVGQVLRVAPPDAGTSVVTNPNIVEVRPLGSAMANSSSAVTAPSSNNRHGPRADKRPYSEAALAELQKSESTDVATGKLIATQGDKIAEKAPAPVMANEIVWVWPVEGKVATNFDSGKSKGVDFPGKPGQNIYAAAAGTVMYAGSGIRGYGNLVIIKHANNFLSAYAHNQSILVKEKQVINKGQKIAEMGNSDSDVVKLHFEVRQQGKPVDPMKFLPAR